MVKIYGLVLDWIIFQNDQLTFIYKYF
jgi:hypothetical protein